MKAWKIILLLSVLLALAACGEKGDITIVSPTEDGMISLQDATSVTTPPIVVNSTFETAKSVQIMVDGAVVEEVQIVPGANTIPGVTINAPGGHTIILNWQKNGQTVQAQTTFTWHPPTGTDKIAIYIASLVGSSNAVSGYRLAGTIIVLVVALLFMFIAGKVTRSWQGVLVGGVIGAFVAILGVGLVMYDSASADGAAVIQTAIGLLVLIVVVWLLSRLNIGSHKSEFHPDGSARTSSVGLSLTGKPDVPMKALHEGGQTGRALGDGLVGLIAGNNRPALPRQERQPQLEDHNDDYR